MNILYLSHLSGSSFAGPTYSVPKQIKAQRKYDNVFWYNEGYFRNEEWLKTGVFHDLEDYPEGVISKLPKPFNNPDLVVVEQFYNMAKSKMLKELVQGSIPYIIIPRGELTRQAQHRKVLKKIIGNLLVFKKFAKKAIAIQYLTEQEYIDSGNKWNKNKIIIPNGILLPKKIKEDYLNDGIRCVSIGRIEPYQKGLDLLLTACGEIQGELEKNNCKIYICGPDTEGKLDSLKEIVSQYKLETIVFFKEPVYESEKEKLLLESDVFLITSRFEGHPMALIEALSYGLPCIATQGTNMKNEVEEFNAGWTATNNVNDIKNALLDMLKDKRSIRMKGENSFKLAREYDWDRLSQKSNELYNELLTKRWGSNNES